MTFSEKIVRLRKIKALTQDEFASAVGVSRQAVYKWESGQSYPEVPKLIEIKLLFGISIDDLLDDTYEVAMPEKKRKKRISKAVKEEIEANIIAEQTDVKEELPENTDVDNASDAASEQTSDAIDPSITEEIKTEEEMPKEEVPTESVTEDEPALDIDAEKEISDVEGDENEVIDADDESVTDSQENETVDKTAESIENFDASQINETVSEEPKDVKKKGFFSRLFSKK